MFTMVKDKSKRDSVDVKDFLSLRIVLRITNIYPTLIGYRYQRLFKYTFPSTNRTTLLLKINQTHIDNFLDSLRRPSAEESSNHPFLIEFLPGHGCSPSLRLLCSPRLVHDDLDFAPVSSQNAQPDARPESFTLSS